MKRVNLVTRKPQGQAIEDWIGEQFAAINEASGEEDAYAAVEPFVFDDADVTETLTADPSSADAATVRNVLFTFLMFLRRGGPNKTQ